MARPARGAGRAKTMGYVKARWGIVALVMFGLLASSACNAAFSGEDGEPI